MTVWLVSSGSLRFQPVLITEGNVVRVRAACAVNSHLRCSKQETVGGKQRHLRVVRDLRFSISEFIFSDEIICKQTQAAEIICSRNPIQSESESEYKYKDADKPRDAFDLAVDHFKEHRKKLKKPMTEHAVELMLGELEKLAPNNRKGQIELIDHAIKKGWQGIYPIENHKKGVRVMPTEKDYTTSSDGYEML